MRTHEQVVADVEQRFKELKEEKRKHDEEMAKPKYTKPCKTCKYFVDGYEHRKACSNPLIRGIKDPITFQECRDYPSLNSAKSENLAVCLGVERRDRLGTIIAFGYEQALWEPRLKWWQKIINRVKGEEGL